MGNRFTRDEAIAKIGKKVRILVDLKHIPVTAGTTGEVVSILSMSEGYDLLIRFRVAIGDVPIIDYFNKHEYENFFDEIESVD
jgi:hypothetical protein